MAYVTVPKDLAKVKNKVAFNLTLRQIICIVVGAALGLPFYFLTRDTIGTSGAATGMVLLMLPEFLFAMYEKDGMHMEKILQNFIRVRFQRPAIRRYETANLYEEAAYPYKVPENKPQTKGGLHRGKKEKVPPAKPVRADAKSTRFPLKGKAKRISVQDSIAYKEMGKDGICRVADHVYSKTIRFYDINYQLAQNDDKSAIFENWCDFLNYFDSSIQFQLSFINQKSSMKEYEKVIQIEPQNDAFDDVRMEYAQMLHNQLAKGNNGLLKSKYITFAIEADNLAMARPKLERIETDILSNFRSWA